MKIKFTSIILFHLALIYVLTGCQEGGQQSEMITKELSFKDHQIDSLQTLLDQMGVGANKAKPISFRNAERIVHAYKSSGGQNFLLAPPNNENKQKLESFHVPKAELMYFIGNASGQLDADGIRFHIAQDLAPTGETYHTFVLMGTEEVVVGGQTYFNDKWSCQLYDFVRPCPTFCDYSRTSGSRFGDQLMMNCDTINPNDD